MSAVTQHDLKQVLSPIWHSKASTAAKALTHLNIAINHAAALGIDVDMQVAAKTRALLGKQRHQVEHIPSVPYAEMPEFYRWLKERETSAALALRFLILTLGRTSEVRLATFDEFDADVWTLDEHRTKNGRLHRIPLTPEALEILKATRRNTHNKFLFPTHRGKPMSAAAMSMFMKRNNFKARPHGFRASFRTWVEEQTDAPFELKEAALGHTVDSKVVEAYQRSDRLEKRRELMQQWDKFLLDAAE